MTKQLHFDFSLSCTGEGNGNPLQCSCLENPRDRGAWWAAVYGVTESWTRLKQLSSSSMHVCQRRQWHPTPVLLPGKSHGQRSLWAAVHGVAKSRTRLNDFTFTFHFHALEKAMATHSSVLAWRISGIGEPGGLPSMGLHRVGHDRSDLAAAAGKNTLAMQETGVPSLGWEGPLEEEMATCSSTVA